MSCRIHYNRISLSMPFPARSRLLERVQFRHMLHPVWHSNLQPMTAITVPLLLTSAFPLPLACPLGLKSRPYFGCGSALREEWHLFPFLLMTFGMPSPRIAANSHAWSRYYAHIIWKARNNFLHHNKLFSLELLFNSFSEEASISLEKIIKPFHSACLDGFYSSLNLVSPCIKP